MLFRYLAVKKMELAIEAFIGLVRNEVIFLSVVRAMHWGEMVVAACSRQEMQVALLFLQKVEMYNQRKWPV